MKPDYITWDSLDSFSVNETSSLWIDHEPTSDMDDDTRKRYYSFRQRLEILIDGGKLDYIEKKVADNILFGSSTEIRLKKSVLKEYAERRNEYPPFLFPEKRKAQEPTFADSIPFMDKKHPNYSSELEAAVSVAMALFFSDNQGEDRKGKTPKQRVLNWLKENRPSIWSKEARERISTLINPDKHRKGGAPKTP